MIPAQPILLVMLAAGVVVYFARLRSRASDSILFALCFGIAVLLVIRPTLATRLAHLLGIGRGVDLIFYLAIPALALLILLLFARTRDLNRRITEAVREMAIENARHPEQRKG